MRLAGGTRFQSGLVDHGNKEATLAGMVLSTGEGGVGEGDQCKLVQVSKRGIFQPHIAVSFGKAKHLVRLKEGSDGGVIDVPGQV